MPDPVMLQHEITTTTATIDAGASLSAGIRLPNAHYLAAILLPAAWTAAGITFQGSADGVTYGDIHASDGTELTLTVAAGQLVTLTADALRAVPFLKVRSGTAAVAVNQAAARTLTLITRQL